MISICLNYNKKVYFHSLHHLFGFSCRCIVCGSQISPQHQMASHPSICFFMLIQLRVILELRWVHPGPFVWVHHRPNMKRQSHAPQLISATMDSWMRRVYHSLSPWQRAMIIGKVRLWKMWVRNLRKIQMCGTSWARYTVAVPISGYNKESK